MLKTPSDVIHRAIKRHAGLSDFDDDAIASEVKAIIRALRRNGYTFGPPGVTFKP